jgi:hypothetical protein
MKLSRFAIRLMIIFGIIFCWALQQVDFVMVYQQAPIKMDIYMELPQGIQTKHGISKYHFLKLEKNVYSQKQAGYMWNSFLVGIGFTTSLIDDCVFFCDIIIFMVYVDDGIFLVGAVLIKKLRYESKTTSGTKHRFWD